MSVAIEPKTKADQDKLTMALAKLADEDPTFLVKFNDETSQTLISGMGELHLEIIVDRLTASSTWARTWASPRSPTARRSASPSHKVVARYVRQTGGHGQYGHVEIDLEPRARAAATSS